MNIITDDKMANEQDYKKQLDSKIEDVSNFEKEIEREKARVLRNLNVYLYGG